MEMGQEKKARTAARKTGEISVRQVQVTDSFFAPLQSLVIDTVIPYQEKILRDEIPGVEKSHAIENFRIAAGLSDEEFYGLVFQDSDLAKWLEGVGYSLAVKPDKGLEARADEIIAAIEQAQQPDGYLNTYFTVKEPQQRWQNLLECHELYCAGHMMEAAAAYYEGTGKDTLLKAMERMADHIISRFGEGKERGIPGHQEIELGLMRLYHVTGKEKYRDMAEFFVEERGKNPEYFAEEAKRRDWKYFGMDPQNTEYNQCHAPVYEQKEAVGHSVRAVYMYTAMAELASACGNGRLKAACEALWENLTERRMYLTGGIGSTVDGEAFTIDYDLPNDTAYAETCASIGTVFFAKKMLALSADGRYADVMERELYNGVISGMQLDGKRFFYVNPLEVNPGISGKLYGHRHVLAQRPQWYTCACCPPNVVRLLASLGKYGWDETEETIYSHLFIGQRAKLGKAEITVESAYPWEGQVCYRMDAVCGQEFTLAIHLPGYVKEAEFTVNGEVFPYLESERKGYVYLRRVWKEGDRVEIRFAMPVRKLYANGQVIEDAGKVALMRGPVVYCFEGVDNGPMLQTLRIPESLSAEDVEAARCGEGPLKGMTLLKMKGFRMVGSDALYFEVPPEREEAELAAIPYFAWGNRGENQMRVWMIEG